jgi:hypothetical protein
MRASDESIKMLRSQFSSKGFRKELKNKLGNNCCNCGRSDHIEYHHIVPVVYGGTNKLSNIVPICVECHYKAHTKSNAEGIINAKEKGIVGRRHKLTYEECFPYIVDYIYGRIGKKEFKARCEYSEKYKLDKCSYIERYKKENGIKSFKNIIDIVSVKGKLTDDKYVGYIEFENGKRRELYYYL